MILPDVHERVARPYTGESFLRVLYKEGIGITVNQTITEFFQRIFYGKNFSSVVEIAWPGPFGKDFFA